MQVPGWRPKNIILTDDLAPDICAALQYIHARMTYEKSVLGLVLGPKEEEVTVDARKFHNEMLSVDQTKGTAQNFYWSVVFNRIECVRRYLLRLTSSERHKTLGSFENCYKLPSSIKRREFRDYLIGESLFANQEGLCYMELVMWLKLVTLMYATLNAEIVLRFRSWAKARFGPVRTATAAPPPRHRL
jgi:hypothetical protein